MASVDIEIHRKSDEKWYFRVSPSISTAVLAFIITDLTEVKCVRGGYTTRAEAEQKAKEYGRWLKNERDVDAFYSF